MDGSVPRAIPASETLAVARAFGLPRRLALRLVGDCDDAWRAAYDARTADDPDDLDDASGGEPLLPPRTAGA